MMERYFNITGACNPQEHYMVNPDSRLAEIKKWCMQENIASLTVADNMERQQLLMR